MRRRLAYQNTCKQGRAEVWAFDLSDEAVRKTKDLVESLHLHDRVHVDQMATDNLDYDSNMFDFIMGNAILHHVDLTASVKEIKRVLKDGGRAFFAESLGHNPFLNLYRILTPNKRSRNEAPLRFEQLDPYNDI